MWQRCGWGHVTLCGMQTAEAGASKHHWGLKVCLWWIGRILLVWWGRGELSAVLVAECSRGALCSVHVC